MEFFSAVASTEQNFYGALKSKERNFSMFWSAILWKPVILKQLAKVLNPTCEWIS